MFNLLTIALRQSLAYFDTRRSQAPSLRPDGDGITLPFMRIHSRPFAATASSPACDKVWRQGVGDKVLGQGVETRCNETRCGDKVLGQGVGAKHPLNPTLKLTLNRHAYSTRLLFRVRQSRQSYRQSSRQSCFLSLRHPMPIREIRAIRSSILPRSGHPKKSCKSCKSCNPVKKTAWQTRKILKIVSLACSNRPAGAAAPLNPDP